MSGGAAATRKTNAGHVLTIEPRPALVGAPVAMSDLEDWANALRKAERELDVATTRSDVNAPARLVMLAKAELKLLEQKTPTRRASGATAPAASV